LNEQGKWQRVDNTLWETEPGVWLNTFGHYKAYFKTNPYEQVYSFVREGHELNYVYETIRGMDNSNLGLGTVTDNYISYPLASSSRIEYYANDYKVKSLAIIERSDLGGKINKDLELVHKINPAKDLTVVVVDDVVEFRDSSGKTIMFIDKPVAYDSDYNFIDLDFEFIQRGNNIFYEIIVPKEWLNSAVFPVYVDPTTSLAEGKSFIYGDTYTDQVDPAVNYGTSASLYVWTRNSNRNRIGYYYINFSSYDFGQHGEFVEITSALLYSRIALTANTHADVKLETFYCNDSFNELTLTWNNQDAEVTNCNATARTSVVSTAYTTAQYYSFNFTSDAQNEYLDDKSFTIKKQMMPVGHDANSRYLEFRAKDSGSLEPYFEITYSYSYTAKGINFYVKNEETNTNMNFNMTVFNSTESITVEDVSNYYLACNLTGDVTVRYTDVAGDYPLRYYYLDSYDCSNYQANYSVSNGVAGLYGANRTLYLLEVFDGCQMDFQVKSTSGYGLANALLTAYRFIDGSWTAIAQAKTGSTGGAKMFLSDSVTLDVEADWDGNTATELREMLTCGKTYTLFITGETLEMYDTLWGKVGYDFSPRERRLTRVNNITATGTTFRVWDSSASLEYFYVNTTCLDSSGGYISHLDYTINDIDVSGGTINTNYNISNDCYYVHTVLGIKHSDYTLWTKNVRYRVSSALTGIGSLFGAFVNAEALGLNIMTLSLISLLIIGFIMFGISSMMGDIPAGVIGLILLGMLSYINWFDWRLYFVVIMGFIGYLVMRREM